MILGTLLDEMERSDRETGLATLCIGRAWVPQQSLNACKDLEL